MSGDTWWAERVDDGMAKMGISCVAYAVAYGPLRNVWALKRFPVGTGHLRMSSHTRATIRCPVLPLDDRERHCEPEPPALGFAPTSANGYAGMTRVAVIEDRKFPCAAARRHVWLDHRATCMTGRCAIRVTEASCDTRWAIAHSHSREEKQ